MRLEAPGHFSLVGAGPFTHRQRLAIFPSKLVERAKSRFGVARIFLPLGQGAAEPFQMLGL